MRYLFSIALIVFFSTSAVWAQKSNVFLFDLDQPRDTVYQFNNPKLLTTYNSQGYNNHPTFIDENVLYVSSQMPGQSQPDIYKMDLRDNSLGRVTKTDEGEYSPFPMPDFYNFSAVRMEFQGRDTLLRLWQFPIDRLTYGRPIFKYVINIGYYCWMNNQQVAAYLVGTPSTLAIGDVRTDQFETVSENVGRCFRMLPNGNLAYIQKTPYGGWQLIEYNIYNKNKELITTMLPNVEDFGVLRDGTIIIGDGSKIYKFNRIRDKDWVEVADLRYYNINNITRIAVSKGNKVAIVAD
ncbi:MAG: hypothetical protein AAFO07_30065 [Bacteroidota bacterium]